MKIKPGEAVRKVTQFHENERLIELAQTTPGRVVVFLLAAGLLVPFEDGKLMMAAVGLVSVMPSARRMLLSLGFIAITPSWDAWKQLIMGVPFYLTYLAAKNFRKLPAVVQKNPQSFLHLGMWLLFGVVWLLPGEGVAPLVTGSIATLMPFFIWRCGYLMMSGKRGTAANTGILDHLYYLWPVYTTDSVPIGKGYDYLTRRESSDEEGFARAQLAGLKVLVLAILWRTVDVWMGGLEAAELRLPFTEPVTGEILAFPLDQLVAGQFEPSILLLWSSLYFELIHVTLTIAVAGHLFVGVLRLCGFYVARNTYKPLLADSLVEFWNRFYYYFKEVLVEFFFFPVYVRWAKLPMKARMFLATFAAAFVGNMYYHVLLEVDAILEMRFSDVVASLTPRLVYCFLLALGIYFSMLRQQQNRGKAGKVGFAASRAAWLLRVAWVWTFYGVIHIWNVKAEDVTLADRNRFFLTLFGIDAG